MKVSTFGKAASVAAAVTLTAGALAPSASATENPATIGYLVGAGSDTTQDVMYGISKDLGFGTEMSSYVAVNDAGVSPSILLRSGKTVSTPNGSGNGFKALLDSIGAPGGTGVANVGDFDFARASGTQGTKIDDGVVTEIPFATDLMGWAVKPDSPFNAANGGKGLSYDDLRGIYNDQLKWVTAGGALSATQPSTGTLGTDYYPIHAYLPKSGSGSRQYFLANFLNVDCVGGNKGDSCYNNAGVPTANAPYLGSGEGGASTTSYQEHNAKPLTDDTSKGAIVPFSIAKYVGYSNGLVTDPDTGKTAGVDYVLGTFFSQVAGAPSTAVTATTGTPGSLKPNTDWVSYAKKSDGSKLASRQVYNIIATEVVNSPNASVKNRALYDTFVGKGSKVCLDEKTIIAYGFLPYASCGKTEGQQYSGTTAGLGYSTPTITATATPAVAGGKTTVTVEVVSTGNGGGVVTFAGQTAVLAATTPGTVPASNPSVTFTVNTPAAGPLGLGVASFDPNLAGVDNGASSEVSLAVSPATATLSAKATAAKYKKTDAKVSVTVKATGVPVAGKATVVVKKGAKTLKTYANKALTNGAATVTLTGTRTLAKGTYDVYVSFTSSSANLGSVASKKVTTLKVS